MSSSTIDHPTINSYDLPCKPKHNAYYESTLTEKQTLALQQLIQNLKNDFPNHVTNTATLCKFLKARKFDVAKAEEMFRNRMNWVSTFKPHKITKNHVAMNLFSGNMFIHGRDINNRPVIVYKMKYHFHKESEDPGHAEFWKYLIFMVERTVSQLLPPPPFDQLILFIDREGASEANSDLAAARKAVTVADYYPETLGSIIVLYPNTLYRMLIPFAKAFIDPDSMKKIHVIKRDKPNQIAIKLHAKYGFENVDDLLEEHGGKVKLKEALSLTLDMSVEAIGDPNSRTYSRGICNESADGLEDELD